MKIIKTIENIDCTKMLLELEDGYIIENCFKYPFWICITTQVGCPVGCIFCHSGKNGFKRNLSKEEMLEQIKIAIEYVMKFFSYKFMFLSVSFTGMGEPLLNIDNVFETILEVQKNSDAEISLTTTGIPEKLQRLFFTNRKIFLDISLHSVNSIKRKKLIPYEYRQPIEETIKFVRKYDKYFEKITFDYLLLRGVNDSNEDLCLLINLLCGTNIHLELKKYNKIDKGDIFEPAEDTVFNFFAHKLIENGISVSIEENVGIEFNAGCGQLAWSYNKVDNRG